MKNYNIYGHFSKDDKEFIITQPNTPRPWINYLSNGEFCTIISQGGGGFSYYKDPQKNMLTRWDPENYLHDTPGHFLYIRDEETKEYWSATYQPIKKYEDYKCVHGLGYTSFYSLYKRLATEMTVFVPQDLPVELRLIKIKNNDNRKRIIKVFPFTEWLLGNYFTELVVRNLSVLMNRSAYDKQKDIIFVSKFPQGNIPWDYFGFMGMSVKPDGFDINRENFVGRYRDYKNPIVVEEGKCTQSVAMGTSMVGVFEKLFEIDALQEIQFVVIKGISSNKNQAIKWKNQFSNIPVAEKELEKTKKFWENAITNNITVETPDAGINRMTNVWLKYQVYMNNHWGRSATYYHECGGEFGYRNTAQDAWGLCSINQGYTKARLIKLLEHQRKSGQPLPGWSQETGPTTHKPPSDFSMWIPMLLLAYLKETGDYAILKKKLKFYDGGMATIYEHTKRAIKFLLNVAKSKRGLPLMGTQDWNDAFDRTGILGKGESVWLGMGACVALENLKQIAHFLKDKKIVQECELYYNKIKKIINTYAWDGDWYVYAFNDFGEPIGSKRNKESKIQLNSQTWAILSGLPDATQIKKMTKIIDTKMETPYGPPLFWPPYTKYNSTIGRITAFAPGTKENAALFCHAGAFKIAADLKLNRVQRAFHTLKQLLPCVEEKDIELYKTEPYVLPEYVIGQGNPNYGEGAFTWLTGSADWLFVIITQQMLGIQPEFNGLLVNPKIPASWKQYRVKRIVRGITYDIIVQNPNNKETGVKEIFLDDKRVESNLIPYFKDGKMYKVKVVMG